LSPKEDYLQGAKLSQPWLGMGLPELLVMDNGLEFHSNQFRLVALHLGIDLLYCAVRQPWLKPHVERVLGSLHGRLPSAGRVRKALTNEVPLKPQETAAITFSALCHGVLKALIDVHALQPNLRKLARPFDLFADGLAELPPPALPTSMEELDIIVAPSRQLTVGNEGVVSEYLRFNSPELQQLRRSTAERFKTLVKFNPEDLSLVHVQDVRSKRWLAVPCCWPEYAIGLSLVQHRAIRVQAKGQLQQNGREDAFMRAKSELADLWQSSTVAGRRLKSAQLRGLSGLTSSHALRGAADAPSLPAPRLLAQEELTVEDAPIPDFETFQV
jgi:putative transposase